MNNGSLDVKNLLLVGFDFLQQYFLTVNESSENIIKSAQPSVTKKPVKFTTYGYAGYGLNYYGGYGPTKSK
jgi:hypothetical protein